MDSPTLKELSHIISDKNVEYISKSKIILRKLKAGSAFLISDLFWLSFSIVVSLLTRNYFGNGDIDFGIYTDVLPIVILVFPIVFAVRGLYPGFGKDVISELKNLTYSITIVFAILGTSSFLVKGEWEFSRLAFLFSWIFSVISVPIGRAYIRYKFSKSEWWGVSVMVIGVGKAGEEVIKSLQTQSQIGLNPLVAVDDDADKWGYTQNVPVVGDLSIIPQLAKTLNIEHAIIAMPGVNRNRQREIIDTYSKYFNQTTVIPDIFGLSTLWVNSIEIGGVLGFEVKQRLLMIPSQIQKRILDVVLTSIIGLVALPLIALVALLIWIDSKGKGKILFKQTRMGVNKVPYSILKFRTMHVDAEQRLNDILARDPALKLEYNLYHKLQDDPRLTKIGKILRKYSIDELPQFWNVLKGEMSLIGPRALLPWEMIKAEGYGEMILKVKPGISGLWQVTDRNGSTFEERLPKDIYYVRNWSIFLDFYIVARTIAVVVLGKGV